MREIPKKVIGESENFKLTNFTHGIDVDQLMFREEIFVQKEWVKSLSLGGYLTSEEEQTLLNELQVIQEKIESGRFNWSYDDEDIHMNIERSLTESLGDLGKKIHLGRSRNDLVATTQRLFVNSSLNQIVKFIKPLIKALCDQSEKYIDIIIPGMTHQQSGQPIRFSHSLMAHTNSLLRDIKRLKTAQDSCLEYLPLGAAAFSGTHIQIDLSELAERMGFKKPLSNSYDAVGDRDFIIDALAAFSTLAVHLIRYSSEVIYQSSGPVGILELPEKWSTGSSIMPNKRNPDILEITRAKMHRVISSLNEGCSIVSSVVPSYGSDLHELKRTFVKSYGGLKESLEILTYFASDFSMDEEKCSSSLNSSHVLATDFANKLSSDSHGDFRTSYLKIKKMVREADEKNIQIHEHGFWPKEIDFLYSVEQRKNHGGTAKERCLEQISSVRKLLWDEPIHKKW